MKFDNGVINANSISMAVVTGGTIGAGKSLTGTLNLGGSSSTTATLNVANSFSIASNNTSQGGNGAIGAFIISTNGIANISTNIVDTSSGAGTSSPSWMASARKKTGRSKGEWAKAPGGRL